MISGGLEWVGVLVSIDNGWINKSLLLLRLCIRYLWSTIYVYLCVTVVCVACIVIIDQLTLLK